MTDFTKYTDANLSALVHSNKAANIVSKKQALIDSVFAHYNCRPTSILFIGFNPAIITCAANYAVTVTEISLAARTALAEQGLKFQYVDSTDLASRKFDVVVAVDEYFTFAQDSDDQVARVDATCQLARTLVISTLRDYKNQDFKDREFSVPAVVRSDSTAKIFTEFHNWSTNTRTQWRSKVFEVDNDTNDLTVYGEFMRHTMYFKQLAKFSIDAGAESFLVHKNLMYKSPIKKTYEHVISIKL